MAETESAEEAIISFERDLEDYLVRTLDSLETGLRLFSERDATGRQYRTEVGIVDILATDSKGNYVVIELKVGKATHAAMGQILGYIGWVQEHLAKNKATRGIIIAEDFDNRLRYASLASPLVTLKKYNVKFSFESVN